MEFLHSTCCCTSYSALDILTNKNYKRFIILCLWGIFNQFMKHLENISYNQGAQTYKNYRNSEKWSVWIIPRVCLPGNGLSYKKCIFLYIRALSGTQSWRQFFSCEHYGPMICFSSGTLYFLFYILRTGLGTLHSTYHTVCAHSGYTQTITQVNVLV